MYGRNDSFATCGEWNTCLFEYTEKEIKKALGGWFEFIGAICHSDLIKLALRTFPNLASAALCWSKWESARMTVFKALVIQPGSSLTEPLLRRAKERMVVRVGIWGEMSPNVRAIFKLVGITGFSLDKWTNAIYIYKKKNVQEGVWWNLIWGKPHSFWWHFVSHNTNFTQPGRRVSLNPPTSHLLSRY